MNWIPIIFVIFKVIVLSTGMFFAVKWHYDQGQKGRNDKTFAVTSTAFKVAGAFVFMAFVMLFFTYELCSKFGLDMSMP
jgi:hypothetical protein